jgi:hypothetical protein
LGQQIVHYRVKNRGETDFVFTLAGDNVEKVVSYKYLGFILACSLDFSTTAKVLGEVINKFITNKGWDYLLLTKGWDTKHIPRCLIWLSFLF